MKLITIFGLIPFLLLYFSKNSIISIIIFINNFSKLYSQSESFHIYVFFINFLIVSHYTYNYYNIIKYYWFLSTFTLLSNYYFFNCKKVYGIILAKIIHLVFVDLSSFIALKKILYKKDIYIYKK